MTTRLRRTLFSVLAMLTLAGPLASPASARPQERPFPDRLALPPGFQPEGIVVGRGHTFYAGSIPTGAIYRGDLRTGDGAVITPGREGTAAIGLAFDQRGRVFAAGGPTGGARVIDGQTGAVLASYQFTTEPSFVNDVVVTRDAAYFTDSLNPVLYRVQLDLGPSTTVALTGDLVLREGFNLNGIEATPNGRTLVVVQSNTGLLFTVDAATGVTRTIDLGGELVRNGDGLLLEGKTLYVVQNRLNLVAVVELVPDLSSGRVVARAANAGFDVPTTIDRFGSRLYVVNARFTTPPDQSTPYWVTGFTKPRAGSS